MAPHTILGHAHEKAGAAGEVRGGVHGVTILPHTIRNFTLFQSRWDLSKGRDPPAGPIPQPRLVAVLQHKTLAVLNK